MNYRHHYHAGNYADVFKHALLVPLIRGLQRKEKGFLYLDTHAGRGGYDLSVPAVLPDGRTREPEHPAGIGRLWTGLPPDSPLQEYLGLVRRFNERRGETGGELRHYPGSPWIARMLLRPQDRMMLCELRPDDAEALALAFAREPRVIVQPLDGYTALKAALPPPEKRALVLIDPPFESKLEFDAILRGLAEAMRRLPGAVCAIWYPVTERARTDAFLHELTAQPLPPTLLVELNIAGDGAQLRMKGCGLLILNPPWQIEPEIRKLLPVLRERLAVDAGAAVRCEWLVPEK
ncbi:MAG: 23S rRNA (adenine(2030)-N(6))-methyltransferase RlmJ [Opitutaceae bacterium]|nr:23S rRNA (adenine(2030)-N(6))-methyltransferase RlmJ [Opitutaceae bacterium]